MIFKSIDKNNQSEVSDVVEMIQQGKQVYILVHKLGCHPCMATRPEWLKMQEKMSNKYKNNNNIAVIDIENDLITGNNNSNNLEKYIGDIDGYPTMKLIKDNGNVHIPYENANISKKDRSVNSFVEWIESNMNSNNMKNMKKEESNPSVLLERLQKNTVMFPLIKRNGIKNISSRIQKRSKKRRTNRIQKRSNKKRTNRIIKRRTTKK